MAIPESTVPASASFSLRAESSGQDDPLLHIPGEVLGCTGIASRSLLSDWAASPLFVASQPRDSRRVVPSRAARLLTCERPARPGQVPPELMSSVSRPHGLQEACARLSCRCCGCCRGHTPDCSLSHSLRRDPAPFSLCSRPGLPGLCSRRSAVNRVRPPANAQEPERVSAIGYPSAPVCPREDSFPFHRHTNK